MHQELEKLTEMDKFLERDKLLRLNYEEKEILEQSITRKEIQSVPKNLPTK
jgi:hypothetical protein